VSGCSWGRCGVLDTVAVFYSHDCDLSPRSGDQILKKGYRDLLDREFVGLERELGQGWGEVVVVVGLHFEIWVGDCVDGGLHVTRGNERREIGYQREKGRRGRLQNRDVFKMLVNFIYGQVIRSTHAS
jgi:hypothetical protein